MAQPKKAALEVIRNLPDRATWDEILYEIYVRKKIERGLAAADRGDVVSHDRVRRRFLRR